MALLFIHAYYSPQDAVTGYGVEYYKKQWAYISQHGLVYSIKNREYQKGRGYVYEFPDPLALH